MRPSRALTVLFGAAVLLAALLGPAPLAAADPFTPTAPGRTVVLDQAGILDDTRVSADIASLPGMDGTFRVGVLASDDPSLREGSYDTDVRSYVLTQRGSSLLRADGTGLADDLLLVTVSPHVRKLGVYAGDGVPLSSGDVEDVVETMRAPARAGSWDETVLAGARTYADLHRTPTSSPGRHASAGVIGWVFGGLAAFVVLVVIARALAERRRHAREERARRERIAADLAERLAWEGPGGPALERALEAWRGIVADARTARQVHVAGVNPYAVLDSLTTAWDNGARPTRAQRLDPYQVRLIEAATGDRLASAARTELDYLLHRDGWQERWDSRLDATRERLAGARDSVSGWLVEEAGPERTTAWNERLDAFEAAVAAVDVQVREHRIDPVEGERRLDSIVNEVRVYLTGQGRELVRGLSRTDRARIARNPRRPEGDLALSTLVLSGVLAAQAAATRTGNPSSGSSGSCTPTTFISTGGFTGGSGSF